MAFMRIASATLLLVLAGLCGNIRAAEPTIEELGRELGNSEVEKRRDAAYALALRGPDAVRALPELIKAIGDSDEQVWAQATRAIANIGPAAEAAVPALIGKLSEYEQQQRYRSVLALAKIGPKAIPALLEGLKHKDSERIRAGCADALGAMGIEAVPAIGALEAQFADWSEQAREHAALALGQIGAPAESVLVKALTHEQPQVRVAALNGLGQFSVQSPEGIAALQKFTTEGEATSRRLALLALAGSAVDKSSLDQPILKALTDAEPAVRETAVITLKRLGSSAPDVVPALTKMLASDDAQLRRTAAVALGTLGNKAAAALPTLIEALRKQAEDESTIVAVIGQIGSPAVGPLLAAAGDNSIPPERLAQALSRIGPAAATALVAELNSKDAKIREIAIRALAGLVDSNPEIGGRIADALQDNNVQVRVAAVHAIGQWSGKGKSHEQALIKLSEDPSALVRAEALSSLHAIGCESDTLKPLLARGLNDSSADVKRSALQSLSARPELAGEMAAGMAPLLADSAAQVRAMAAKSLGLAAKQAAPALPGMVKVLGRENNADVRVEIVTAIGLIGENPEQSLAALEKCLSDDDPRVLQAAILAVGGFKDAARGTVPKLSPLATHAAPSIRSAALETLAALAEKNPDSANMFITALSDEDWTVRRAAAQSLGTFGAAGKRAVPLLFGMLDDDQDRDYARAALKLIDAADADAVPVLLEGLNSEDRMMKYYAAFFLKKVGPAGKEALPTLKEMAQKEDGRFGDALRDAITAIESPPSEGNPKAGDP